MKKFCCILFLFSLTLSLLPVPVSAINLNFTDVDPQAWYTHGISYVTETGIMKGVSSDRFSPAGAVTRAMMVTVLWRIAQEPVVNTEEEYWLYFDIPENAYYAAAADWAKVNHIMEGYLIPYNPEDPPTGYSCYNFRPDNALTREQLATAVYRYAKWNGIDVTVEKSSTDVFPDSASVSSWAKEAMDWCIASGLIQGTTQKGTTILNPKGTTTRAQLATILMRFEPYSIATPDSSTVGISQ